MSKFTHGHIVTALAQVALQWTLIQYQLTAPGGREKTL